MSGLVVGTAGHIDHGKTSMVRVLTGVDLDSLPEEQDRGITIALGFTPVDLPGGGQAAFVDVPGHERLVRTMVAGSTGIDAVLLCVSAVDGVMPQTREHLAILELLGVQQGAVVLTMVDLVDAEMCELAADDVADVVAGSFLEGAPIIPFSAVTEQGRDEVLAAIRSFEDSDRSIDGLFRLPVDRAFVRPGFGTVVTGTTWSGSLADGSTVHLLPGETTARVRGIQVHGQKAKRAVAGKRTALNLAGIDTEAVPRGTVIGDPSVPCPSMVDVHYQQLPDAPLLEDGAQIRVLLGTAERLGRIHFAADLDELAPGRSTCAQIRLEAPLPCLPGDRFVARRSSPVETLGGGRILDPWAGRMRRKSRVAWGSQLERLERGQLGVYLERAGDEGLSPQDWLVRGGGEVTAVLLGGRVLAPTVAARLQGALLEALTSFHTENPLALGANRRELKRGRLGHLSPRLFDALVEQLASSSSVQVDGPLVRVVGFEVGLDADEQALKARLEKSIQQAGVGGIKPKELHAKHKEAEVSALLRLVESEGTAHQLPGLGWVAQTSLDELRVRLKRWFAQNEAIDPGAFKELTQLTRKGAIPLMEWMDSQKWTRRTGDRRVQGKAL